MRRRGPREIRVIIEDVDDQGRGIASFEERRVVVKNALKGERVNARVLKRRRGEWFAEALTPEPGVFQPVAAGGSPIDAADADGEGATVLAADRVEPPCDYFPRCGGCAMMHISYQRQLALKQGKVDAELRAAGVKPARINPPVTATRLHYRTKARLGVRVVGGQVLVGFRETYSNRVGRMDACAILIPEFARLITPLKQLVADLDIAAQVPQIELAAGDRVQALIVRHLAELGHRDREKLLAFGAAHRVRLFVQPGGYDSVTELGEADDPYLGYSNPDFGLRFQFLPTDFTQVNLHMNRLLVRDAILALDAPAGAHVVDLFAGIGNFSLALAARGCRVSGFEVAEQSVVRARMNAVFNGLDERCEFQVADLYDAASELTGEAAYMLLDPPRSGAGPNLKRWVQTSAPQRIAYVSCQPSSFASDARLLQDNDFQLEQVGIFDMFPHTAHIETLGVFSR